MIFFQQHILTLLMLIPLLSAAVIAVLPDAKQTWVRSVALSGAVFTLLISLYLLLLFDANLAGIQLFDTHIWSKRLGTAYAVGIDGISLPMVILTALLSLVALMVSDSIKQGVKGYYALMLILESAILGVFMAQDWSLFYMFWEMTLIPLFFLIDRWGGENRQAASLNFVLYTMGGSVFMLISILVLFDHSPDHSFAMSSITTSAQSLSVQQQVLIFLGLLIGFGVKTPIFPLHGWLSLAHVEAPSPVSILLSGILLKMGAYGLIRAITMLPDAAMALQPLLAGIGFMMIVYGGLLAWRQSDLRKMIAYSSVGHMGVVVLGIATLNMHGLSGAVAQMVAHGLVAGATFLLVGQLYQRTHTRNIADYSSLITITPRFTFFMLLAFVAAVGMPGRYVFVAELHVLIGGFERWSWWILLASFGVIISAVYALRTVGRLFTGSSKPAMQDVKDMTRLEMFAVSMLLASIFILGLIPGVLTDLSSLTIKHIAGLFQ